LSDLIWQTKRKKIEKVNRFSSTSTWFAVQFITFTLTLKKIKEMFNEKY
jgi:hypothetical protein